MTSHPFNKDTKSWYSWIPKGSTSAIINQTIVGFVNMIAAFCSNGNFICSLYRNTINSEEFCDFIKLLKYSLLKLNIDIRSQVVIVIDNASYHSSAKTIEWLRNQQISVQFLPPYCPTLAPVETLFKFIKSGVRKLSKHKEINFSKPSGVEIIRKSCSQVTDEARHEAWISFVREALKSIEIINNVVET